MSRQVHVCEVLVIGAGPAGLVAAYRAAQSGKEVTVVDDNPDAGGSDLARGKTEVVVS